MLLKNAEYTKLKEKFANFCGDITNLDAFFYDCNKNKDLHNLLKKEINKQSKLTMIFPFFLIASFLFNFISIYIAILSTICTIIIFIFMIIDIRKSIKKEEEMRKNMYNGGDNIKYNNISKFLNTNNIFSFSQFGESFCVNSGKPFFKQENKLSLKNFIYFFCLWSILPILTIFISLSKNISLLENDLIFLFFALSIFLGVSSGMFVWGILPLIKKYIVCNEETSAVCIEVQTKVSTNSDGHSRTLYRPFYYIKYNSFGYILFPKYWTNKNDSELGDFIEKFYINSKNPTIFRTKGEWKNGIVFVIMFISFLIPYILVMKDVLYL